MTLVRSSLLNGIAVLIKLATGLIVNKVLAVLIGPAGYAVIGQFNSVVGIVMAFATGGVTNGVVKYTAERWNTPLHQYRLWATATYIVLSAAIGVGAIVFFLSPWLAVNVLDDVGLRPAFYWLAGSLVLFAANSLLLAVLNGKKELRRYVIANITGSLVGLFATLALAIIYGLLGALIAASLSQSITFFCTLFACRKLPWLRSAITLGRFDKMDSRRLAAFSLMALTSALCIPFTQALVRDHLASTFGWAATGQWQGVLKISDMYLMLITSTLSVYYLPRLSELKDDSAMRREIVSVSVIVLPITAAGALLCYLLRDVLIAILFSDQFSGMRDLFIWQFVGDVLRIGSWLVGFVFHARALTGQFIASELLYAALFYSLVHALTPRFGIEGATIAYAFSYGLYWLWIMVILRKFLIKKEVHRSV